MYFSLSDYKQRTKNLTSFSASDVTGLYVSGPERWVFTGLSRLWRAFFKPRMGAGCAADTPLLAAPPNLRPEHVEGCKVFASRYSMIESMEKQQVWAEVGTFEGEFARLLVELCEPSELHVFDLDFSRVAKAGHIFETGTVKFRQGDSAERLKEYPDAYFDCIYLDGGHDLSAVARDVDVARSKLKRNGLLLFNDYIAYSHVDQLPFGIVPVVNSLCIEDGWRIESFALDANMYCDVALRRMAP